MPVKGNVVRYGGEKELYVVTAAESSGNYPNRKLDKISLIPFKHSNCSTHLSRKHPLTTRVKTEKECIDGECCHFNDECPWDDVPSETHNVDNIEYVADNVEEFMIKKLKGIMYE